MRFLMKNHRGTPNTALTSCVPAKTFWMRSGPAAVFAPSAKPRLAIWVIAPAQIELIDLLGRAQSYFSRLLLQQYAHCKSLLAPVST